MYLFDLELKVYDARDLCRSQGISSQEISSCTPQIIEETLCTLQI